MRIVMTGATGFIGRAVVATLCREHHVIALVREGARPDRGLGCDSVTVDPVREPAGMSRLPKRADAVVHLAHYRGTFPGEAREVFESDTAMTLQLLEYARSAGVRNFVYGSTGSVYGPRPGTQREEDPPEPDSFYAVVKYASELLLRPYREWCETCILRIYVPYGRGQENRMIPAIARRILSRQPVILTNGGQPRSNPIYIDDLAEIFREAVRREGHNLINVGGAVIYSIADIARMIGSITGVAPVFEERSSSERFDLVGDTRRMREAFPSIRPRDLEAGLRAMFGASPLLQDKR